MYSWFGVTVCYIVGGVCNRPSYLCFVFYNGCILSLTSCCETCRKAGVVGEVWRTHGKYTKERKEAVVGHSTISLCPFVLLLHLHSLGNLRMHDYICYLDCLPGKIFKIVPVVL